MINGSETPTVEPSPSPCPASAPRTRRLRRWLGYSAFVLALLVASLMLLYVLLQQPESEVLDIAARVHSFKTFGVLIQICMVAAVVMAWRQIVDLGLRRGIVVEREYEKVLALRWKVFAFLTAYLVLVPIGPDTIYRFFVH